jgi:hypothetical protein
MRIELYTIEPNNGKKKLKKKKKGTAFVIKVPNFIRIYINSSRIRNFPVRLINGKTNKENKREEKKKKGIYLLSSSAYEYG